MPGTIVEAADGSVTVRTALGEVWATEAQGIGPASRRSDRRCGPDRSPLLPQPAQANDRFARIITLEFVGATVTALLETADGSELQVQRPLHAMEGGKLQVGRTFIARWPPEHGSARGVSGASQTTEGEIMSTDSQRDNIGDGRRGRYYSVSGRYLDRRRAHRRHWRWCSNPDTAQVIDRTDRLVMPGWSMPTCIPGRRCSRAAMTICRSTVDADSYPTPAAPAEARLIDPRTMLVGMESLKNGVTCVVDDIIELPGESMAGVGAAFQAYEDLGTRANVSGHIINKTFTETISDAAQLPPNCSIVSARKHAALHCGLSGIQQGGAVGASEESTAACVT